VVVVEIWIRGDGSKMNEECSTPSDLRFRYWSDDGANEYVDVTDDIEALHDELVRVKSEQDDARLHSKHETDALHAEVARLYVANRDARVELAKIRGVLDPRDLFLTDDAKAELAKLRRELKSMVTQRDALDAASGPTESERIQVCRLKSCERENICIGVCRSCDQKGKDA